MEESNPSTSDPLFSVDCLDQGAEGTGRMAGEIICKIEAGGRRGAGTVTDEQR